MTKPKENTSVEERIRINLVKFIEESGYTQNMVADLSGVPPANLGRYCRGENAVPAAVLAPLAEVFGRSVSDFFLSDPPPADLESALPVFLKHRPGSLWTEEDQKDADEFLERIRNRRVRRRPTKKGT